VQLSSAAGNGFHFAGIIVLRNVMQARLSKHLRWIVALARSTEKRNVGSDNRDQNSKSKTKL
jgi:hypothetical protein